MSEVNEKLDWGLNFKVDPTAVKEAHDKDASGGNNKWKISLGKKLQYARLRILPNPHANSQYFTMFFHYGVQKFGIACPKKNLNTACPICETFDQAKNQLIEEQEKYQKENPKANVKEHFKKQWKALFGMEAKPRYFVSVLDRAGATPEVKYLEMSQTVKDTIIPKILEKIAYLHPLKGRDWVLNWVQKENSQFGDVKVDRDDDPSPILPNGNMEEINKLIDGTPNLKDLITHGTYDEIKKWLDNSVKEDEEDETSDNVTVVVDEKKSELAQKSAQSLDDLFDKN